LKKKLLKADKIINSAMRKDIHPKNYRLVAFKDMSNGETFITKSTAASRETIKMDDGIEYPLIKLEISSLSHPFFTGKMKLVDTAGRVDKFMNRYKTHLDKKKK
jgi:large subunit ribosomal protein L31